MIVQNDRPRSEPNVSDSHEMMSIETLACPVGDAEERTKS